MERRQCKDPARLLERRAVPHPGGLPDLAHDDAIDACSGALEMLNPPMQNPPMQSWGAYELARQMAEEVRAAQERKPQPAPPIRPPVR